MTILIQFMIVKNRLNKIIHKKKKVIINAIVQELNKKWCFSATTYIQHINGNASRQQMISSSVEGLSINTPKVDGTIRAGTPATCSSIILQ